MIYCKDFWVFWTWFIVAKMLAILIQRLQSIKSIALDMDYSHFTIHPTSNVSDILVLWQYLNFANIFGTMDEGISHPEKSRFHVILSLLRVWLLRAWNQWNKDVKPGGTCWKKHKHLLHKYGGLVLFWLWNFLDQIFVAVLLGDSPLSRHRLLRLCIWEPHSIDLLIATSTVLKYAGCFHHHSRWFWDP